MLNPQNVHELFINCLYKNEELINNKTPNKPTIVEGIDLNVGFNPDKIEKNKEEIRALINQLHSNFKNGWSFLCLNTCQDGNIWTGSHRSMEQLLVLGLAIGALEYACPRTMWDVLPGGMPYIILKD